jgi:hypothetical protein
MRLRIHRGANEIGGNCVEIESRGHSILLDLGLPLTADAVDPSLLPDIPGLTDGSNPHLLGGRPAGARRLQQFGSTPAVDFKRGHRDGPFRSDRLTVLLRIDGCRGLPQNFTFISNSILAFARHSCRAFAFMCSGLAGFRLLPGAVAGVTFGRHYHLVPEPRQAAEAVSPAK